MAITEETIRLISEQAKAEGATDSIRCRLEAALFDAMFRYRKSMRVPGAVAKHPYSDSAAARDAEVTRQAIHVWKKRQQNGIEKLTRS